MALSRKSWVRIPLQGLGPHSGYTGHFIIAHSSSPNEEQNGDLVKNVYAPALLARRDVCLQHLRLPKTPRRMVLALDGESQQLSAVASEDVKAALNAAGITAFKHPASLTGEVQLNDLASCHQTIHSLVKSGKAGSADPFWVLAANAKVLTACAVAKSGIDDDSCTTGKVRLADWSPSASVKARILKVLEVMPPVMQQTCISIITTA